MLEIMSSRTTTTVVVSGDLDAGIRPRLNQATARVSTLGRHLLVVDLCRMDFLDSTGAAFLATAATSTARSGGVAQLRGVDDEARFVLEVCGVLPLFRVDDEHECVDPDVPA